MKALTEKDVADLAGQLERTAKELRKNGKEAVRRARDWASPLRSSGTDPGRGVGGHGDPTASAAFSRPRNEEERERQRAAEEMTLLWVDAKQCGDAAYALEHRIVNITTDAVVENQRAGIGTCTNPDCFTYCDGTTRRLRNLICPACYAKELRTKPACSHDKQVWHNGVRTCCGCGVELTEAGVAK